MADVPVSMFSFHKKFKGILKFSKSEYDDLQTRYNIVSEERNHLDSELREREKELKKLRDGSEKLFKEYQQLKNQHEVDAGVMHKVMQQAGEWYKQNKQLKSRSTALMQALPAKAMEIDLSDSMDTASDTSSNEEVEFLKQTVANLSQQIASLKTELNQPKLHEFEAHEADVAIRQELGAEKEESVEQEKELQELRVQVEIHNRECKPSMEEVTALKDDADKDREMAETYQTEAHEAKKPVVLLTHQSALQAGELLGDAAPEQRLDHLLNHVALLKGVLEEQSLRHRDQLHDLQEKITLAEEDAQKAFERVEKAERRLAELERNRSPQKKSAEQSEMQDQNNLLSLSTHSGGAIDAIVDQIKEGKFHLKSTEQKFTDKKTKPDEQPEAVKEILGIIGTLRKRRTSVRLNFVDSE